MTGISSKYICQYFISAFFQPFLVFITFPPAVWIVRLIKMGRALLMQGPLPPGIQINTRRRCRCSPQRSGTPPAASRRPWRRSG